MQRIILCLGLGLTTLMLAGGKPANGRVVTGAELGIQKPFEVVSNTRALENVQPTPAKTPNPAPNAPAPSDAVPATPEPVASGAVSSAPATSGSCTAPAPVPTTCCQPCIIYRPHGCRKVCCGCEPPTKGILHAKNPGCCCSQEVDIPICLPACCSGDPQVCGHGGICGRGVVEYRWCCGFHVKVVFTACGDIIVHSWGC